MNIQRWMIATLLLVLLLGSVGGGAASQTETRSGLVVEVKQTQVDNLKDAQSELTSVFPEEPRSNVFYLYTPETTYIVFTDAKVKAGKATVSGTVYTSSDYPSGKLGASVIFADSVRFDQSGQKIAYQQFKGSAQSYDGQLIETTIHYQQVAYLAEVRDSSHILLQSVAQLGGKDHLSLKQPGVGARERIFEFSQLRGHSEVGKSFRNSGFLTTDIRSNRFWIDAKTRVTAGVIAREGMTELFLVDSEVITSASPTPSKIATSGGEFTGDVVQTQGQTVGVTISVQEQLLKVAKCAPQSVTNPGTGCMPLPVDATIHAGVMVGGGPTELVPYIALSNHHQQKVIKPELGEYRLKGRVVSSNQLSPAMPDGYGLLTFDMQRTGDLTIGAGAKEQATERRQTLVGSTRKQVRTGSSGGAESAGNAQQGQAATSTTATPAPAKITISSVEVQPDRITDGETAAVTVKLKNTGERSGLFQIAITGTNVRSRAKEVRVGGGSSKTVVIPLTITAQDGEKAVVKVNEERAGIVHVGERQTAVDAIPFKLIGWMSAGWGIALILFAGVVQTLRYAKSWYGEDLQTTERVVNIPAAAGFVLGITGLGLTGLRVLAFAIGGMALVSVLGIMLFQWVWERI